MNKAFNFIKRLILFFVGMSVIQLGVALYLKVNIGSDPFTVFTQGLAQTLDKTPLKNFGLVHMIAGSNTVTPGVANMMILVVLFIGILLVDMKKIKIGTLICVVGVGPIIDLGGKLVSFIPVDSYNYFVKILLVVLGCAVIAIGFAVLSAANVGVAPNDIVPFIIQDKTKAQYKWIRICIDAFFLIGGFFLGGTVGVGTVLAMLVTGPFIQFCLPYGQKFVNMLVKDTTKEETNVEPVVEA